MNIKEYEAVLVEPLHQVTLVLLLKEGEILLAMKKRGFGQGKWNGVGGKANPNETILEAAIRETEEEIGVTPVNLQEAGIINFFHPYSSKGKAINQQVHVFISSEWVGDPIETEEMKPKWFNYEEIPYQEMWWDDEIWFPIILNGNNVVASFMFDQDENIIDQILETAKRL